MNIKKFIIALSGLILEQYEYTLFGFSAGIIAINFFPPGDNLNAIIYTFGIFGSGYVAKILGALFLGRIGDYYGRKHVLKISMVGVALSTITISFLPGYNSFGYISPLLLLCCRFLQGFFVAGEYDGVSIYILEHIDKKRSCFVNSIIGLCYSAGVYLASLAVLLTQFVIVSEWAFRLPFLFGGVFAFLVLFFRRSLEESKEYEDYFKGFSQHSKPKQSFTTLIKKNKKKLFMSFSVFASIGTLYNFFVIFWHTYVTQVLKILDVKTALLYTSVIVASHALVKPLIGLLGDLIGEHNLLKIGSCLIIIIIGMLGYYINNNNYPLYLTIVMGIGLCFLTVGGYVYLMKFFDVPYRFSSLNLSHALASSIFSGSCPYIGIIMWQKTGNIFSPLYYILIFPILLWFVLIINRKCVAH